MRLDAYRNLSI